MKYILTLLLLTFSVSSFACSEASHADIDSCSLDQKFYQVMERLHPSHEQVSLSDYNSVSGAGDIYTFSELEIDSPHVPLYERLIMLGKQAESVFDSELAALKTQLKSNFDVRASIDVLDRFHRRADKCGYSQPNMALLKKDMKAQLDTVKRDCMSSKTAELDAEDSMASLKESTMKDLAFCKSLEIEFIALIRSAGQDDAKAERLVTKLAPVREAMGIGNVRIARARLFATVADADLPQGTIDTYVAKMDAFLAQ